MLTPTAAVDLTRILAWRRQSQKRNCPLGKTARPFHAACSFHAFDVCSIVVYLLFSAHVNFCSLHYYARYNHGQ
jgi:hypothetical protein